MKGWKEWVRDEGLHRVNFRLVAVAVMKGVGGRNWVYEDCEGVGEKACEIFQRSRRSRLCAIGSLACDEEVAVQR